MRQLSCASKFAMRMVHEQQTRQLGLATRNDALCKRHQHQMRTLHPLMRWKQASILGYILDDTGSTPACARITSPHLVNCFTGLSLGEEPLIWLVAWHPAPASDCFIWPPHACMSSNQQLFIIDWLFNNLIL